MTGAAKRIGRAIALRLSSEGAQVAIHFHHSEAEARDTAAECGDAPVFKANLESVAEIDQLFTAVLEHFGRLDGLVNNAARFTKADPLTLTEAEWDFIHSVNLKSVFFCCQAAARRMNEGSRIVNLSSLGGLRPWAEHAHYCASKAGVIMLTQSLAKAFAPRISVNSVAPGLIPFERDDARTRSMIENTPMHRGGEADEVADAVAYFLTAPSFITGQILAVDGGLSLR